MPSLFVQNINGLVRMNAVGYQGMPGKDENHETDNVRGALFQQ